MLDINEANVLFKIDDIPITVKDLVEFKNKTLNHIEKVIEWYNKIHLFLEQIHYSTNLFYNIEEIQKHDESKLKNPHEFDGYLVLHKISKLKIDYNDYPEVKNIINSSTIHHISTNNHHPEFWDKDFPLFVADKFNLNHRNRNPEIPVDARLMPSEKIIEMVADWFAISEVKHSHPLKWARKTINKRWIFSKENENLIYFIIENVWKR